LPVKSEEKGTFTREQVSKLVRAADADWRNAILFGYYTGARLSDVANMRWSAIDWNNKIIRFAARKTGKAVTLPLHPQLERELLKKRRHWQCSDLPGAGRQRHGRKAWAQRTIQRDPGEGRR
jgi:integrase